MNPTEDPPSRLEYVAATSWLYLRRLVCFGATIFFLFLFIQVVFDPGWTTDLFKPVKHLDYWDRLKAGAIMLLLCAISIFVGIYGITSWDAGGYHMTMFRYRKNKARYGWRW